MNQRAEFKALEKFANKLVKLALQMAKVEAALAKLHPPKPRRCKRL